MSLVIIDNLDAYAYNIKSELVRDKSLRERFYPSRGLSMPKTVLITGASSGFGRDMAETLLCWPYCLRLHAAFGSDKANEAVAPYSRKWPRPWASVISKKIV